jgi:hypothetical protein
MRIRRLPPAKAVPLGWRLPQDRARCGVDVSVIAQTGHSEAIHSPDAWPSIVVELMIPATWPADVVCTMAISCCPSVLRTMSRPLDSGARLLVSSDWIVAVSDFSGLTSSPWVWRAPLHLAEAATAEA